MIGKGSFINDINRFSWLFCPSHPHIAPYSQLLVMNFLSILDSSPVTSLMQLGPPIWSQKILIFRVCKSWKKHFCFNVSVKQYSIDHSLGTTLNRCKYPLWQYGCRVYKQGGLELPYARHHKPLLITNHSWIQAAADNGAHAIERFLPKNQHTQRKFLNLEN